jgi:hypothetical protein
MWPQCWDLQGPRGLEQRDLRNLNLGDLKKGPNGGVKFHPTKKKKSENGGGEFEILTAVVMKSSVSYEITPCSPLKSTYVSEEHVASIFRLLLAPCFMLVFYCLTPRWSQHVSPKRRLTFNGLHGVILQEMKVFKDREHVFECSLQNLGFVSRDE